MMNSPNNLLPSSAPSASSALLTAALGGLLCFTASCSSQAITPVSDSGAGADTGASVDGGAVVDTGVGRDAGTATDTPASTDVVTATDAPVATTDTPVTTTDVVATTDVPVAADTPVATDTPAPSDALFPIDSATDAGSAIDATSADATVAPDVQPDVPLIVRDAGCDVAADRQVSLRDSATGMSLTIFVERCNGVGGFVEIHPHCGGANSCAGFSWDQTINTYSEHNCQGLNTCTGFTCIVP